MVLTKGYRRIRVLFIENGCLVRTRVVDFGSFLGKEISQDKWMAWAKGKPLLIKSRFKARYTYLITPEVGWTLDGSSIVSIMLKGKDAIAPKFTGAPTYKVLPNGNGSKAVQAPKLTGVITNDDVSKLIDEKLHNGFKKELLDEIKLLIVPAKQEEPPKVVAPSPPIATNDMPSQPVEAKPLEQIPVIGPPIPMTTQQTTEVKESK